MALPNPLLNAFARALPALLLLALLPQPAGAAPVEAPPADCTALPQTALQLGDVVDIALCRNPRSAQAWARLRAAQASHSAAYAPYLPALNFSSVYSDPLVGSDSSSDSGSGTRTRLNNSATLSYLLLDSGGRRAALDRAAAWLDLAQASRIDVLQAVYLDAVTAYYAWLAAEGAFAASRESERAAQSSLDAAVLREAVGSGTRADRLQAQTAHARSQLLRAQAEGRARAARGELRAAMGLPANAALDLAAVEAAQPAADYEQQLEPLIAASLQSRADLLAAEASLRAAEANLRAVKSSGLPTLSSTVTQRWNRSAGELRESSALGLTLSVPLFRGFEDHNRVRAAEAERDLAQAELQRLRLAASTEVYLAHSELITQTQAARSAAILLDAAQESESLARARYEAGIGIILDLINAQNAAADARQQLVLARSNWAAARTRLARTIGALDIHAAP